MNYKRKLERANKKKQGTLIHKKSIARKMGITVSQLNEKIKKKEEANK